MIPADRRGEFMFEGYRVRERKVSFDRHRFTVFDFRGHVKAVADIPAVADIVLFSGRTDISRVDAALFAAIRRFAHLSVAP